MDKEKLKKIKALYYPYKFVKCVIMNTQNSFQEAKVRRLLRNIKQKSTSSVIKVGFIVQMPNLWDKLINVYKSMESNENFEVTIIVVPSYNFAIGTLEKYDEDNYFLSKYPNAIKAVSEHGEILNLRGLNLDYVFLQRPYDIYLPNGLKSSDLVSFTKLCYIPYGFSMSRDYTYLNTNYSFFRNIYFNFLECREIYDILTNHFKRNIKDGLQKFVYTSYPEFDSYRLEREMEKDRKTILWTPRWSYDSVLGGSHFFEYKDQIIEFVKNNSNVYLIIRPHPLMFENFVKEKLMSEEDVGEFVRVLGQVGIELSTNRSCYEDLSRADILLTDYSSIIAPFFTTGKPIVFCERKKVNAYTESELIFQSVYTEKNWSSIENRLCELLMNNDYMREKRVKNIKEITDRCASQRIVDLIMEDFYGKD